ncbi:hypothetical protein M3B43_09540 [Nesterenkonia massiliensis]|uniref:Flagellin n=1 Tax=Nesterenkonia massiliensis TaxID=1232429 RepID=A0ABT2HS95_9MICC|nr:hypothetical protein [Nesterenkonia massiliensis]MCT1607558.1 hypothetical protein [Nesterenkonia massiliensis]
MLGLSSDNQNITSTQLRVRNAIAGRELNLTNALGPAVLQSALGQVTNLLTAADQQVRSIPKR